MEYETFISGIGGQGIQLVSKMFAVAAMANDRHVMLNGVYGGEMRGGKSLATVVIGSRPLRALPVTAHASAAVLLHSNFWREPSERLRADALILADEEIAGQLSPLSTQTFLTVPATRLAREIGNPQVGGMILMSAYAAITGLVTTEQLLTSMRSLVPAHRAQHLAANEKALEAGRQAVSALSHRVDLDRIDEKAVA
jgi:Pyruvate/2-oxoacid:ferredoxin oxidoreductase gamma subunit